jgi:hypothetical protein
VESVEQKWSNQFKSKIAKVLRFKNVGRSNVFRTKVVGTKDVRAKVVRTYVCRKMFVAKILIFDQNVLE